MIVHRCRASHHVFSSHRGYRTLFASRELPEEVKNFLENYASRVYQRASAEAEYDVFDLPDGALCLAKRFRAGADHVGRPRNCVHTVILNREDIREIRSFNPFFVLLQDAGFFLETDFEINTIADHLPSAFMCANDEFDGLLDILDKIPHSKTSIRTVLNALLSGAGSVVIRADDTAAVGKLVAFVSLLLPPALRARINLVSTMDISGMDYKNKIFVLLRGRKDSLEGFASNNEIVLDFATSVHRNQPEATPYSAFIMDNLFEEKKRSRVKSLLSLMERYAREGFDTESQLKNFINGLGKVGHLVMPDGRLMVGAEPQTALESVMMFHNAGCIGLVLDIIRDTAAFALNPESAVLNPIAKRQDLRSLVDLLQRTVPDASDSSAFDIELAPRLKRKPPTLFFERPMPGDIAEWED
ncbi:MAG: hypothetical protein E3J72_04340 [Planctomycetota bacterium]|nr:MAG: hypothetical protein E3J72_04340 [Planctomycetota bacterium]